MLAAKNVWAGKPLSNVFSVVAVAYITLLSIKPPQDIRLNSVDFVIYRDNPLRRSLYHIWCVYPTYAGTIFGLYVCDSLFLNCSEKCTSVTEDM